MRSLLHFNEIDLFDLLDIVVMTFLIYTVLVWFKRTRAAAVLVGILIIAGFYLIARQFNLFLTASVFQAFFAIILVAVVVIFQEELRHFFERVAVLGLTGRFQRRRPSQLAPLEVSILVRTLVDLAKEKIGALIVLQGKDLIVRHLEGGEELNGTLSEALLKSIFDPHTPGHDGAMIIEGNTVARFACHLPLSKNFRMVGKHGTRHAAALGLSELSDALALVVSEEQGTISYARGGELDKIADPTELNHLLERFYREVHPPKKETQTWQDFFKRNFKEKVLGLVIACVLWFFQVHGAKVIYRTYTLPIQYPELPENLVVTNLEPAQVDVTFSAPRRSFYFLPKEKLQLLVKTWQGEEGERTIRISAADLTVPENFAVENIVPKKIRVQIEKKSKGGS